MPGTPPPRWHDAAASASFVPYELIDPVPLARYPGGIGYTDLTTVANLDIQFVLASGEVGITTRLRDERLATIYQPLLVNQVLTALWSADLTLPVTIRLEESAREVLVDGNRTTFHGVAAVDHGLWSGWTLLPTCIVQINLKGDVPGPLVIAACTDLGALPEGYA